MVNKTHILIIGGMGPQASIFAHKLVIDRAALLGAHENEDFPRITHLSINVKEFISTSKNRLKAEEYLLRAISEVDTSTVSSAFMACNTAHILFDSIQHAYPGLNLISMIDITKELLKRSKLERVGILATPSTLRTGLYKNLDVKLVQPDKASIVNIERIIRSVINGEDLHQHAKVMEDEVEKLKDRGAQAVILGCTELSLLGSLVNDHYLIDPLALTVNEIVV